MQVADTGNVFFYIAILTNFPSPIVNAGIIKNKPSHPQPRLAVGQKR